MYGKRSRPCFVGDHGPKDSQDLKLSREGSRTERYKKVAKTLHYRGSGFTRWKDFSWPCFYKGLHTQR